MSRSDEEINHAADAVKVVCRVRPFSAREIDIHLETHGCDEPIRPILLMDGQDTIFLDPETFTERERFTFDHSLWSVSVDSCKPGCFASQERVMEAVGLPAVSHVWGGYNTSLFAYGQTGSGKTYTMMGSDEEPGLIPRMCQELFRSLEAKRTEDSGKVFEGTTKEYRLEARFLEIYNDKVKDLLWELRDPAETHEGIDHENLKVRHLPNVGPLIVGLTAVVVDNWEDCLRLIEEGTRHRSVAATKMNATSSRSHSIFRLNFVQTTRILATRPYEKPKSFDKVSNVCLVDLAGSERNKKTGAQGDRLKEAVAINKSLTALKNVIDALVEGRPVIPFRDSQLTFLLSESLGGNSKTFMISCASPHSDNADETLNTLRYALRAQGIVCHAQVNESEESRRMTQMRHELEQLRQLKEEPQEQLTLELRKAHEGKREQLLSMQSVSAQQQVLQQELQRHADFSGELRHNSKFQMAFRVIFARRVEKECHQQLQLQECETDALRAQLRDADRIHQSAMARRSAAVKSENDARTLFRAREKELESLKARNGALEWRKRSLLRQDEQLRIVAERKLNLKPTVTLVTKILAAYNLHKHQKMFGCASEAADCQVRRECDDAALAEVSRRSKKDQLLGDASDELVRLEKELSIARKRLHDTQHQYTNRIQGLHAECIFLETEIKEITEVHEKGAASMNKTKAALFFSTKEDWTAKLQKCSMQMHEKIGSLLEEIMNHLDETRSHEDAAIKRVEADAHLSEERVAMATARTAEQLNASQKGEDERIEALNRESHAFISTHRQIEQRYRNVYESLSSRIIADTDTEAVQNVLFSRTRKCTARSFLEQKFVGALPAHGNESRPTSTVRHQPTPRAVTGPSKKVVPTVLARPGRAARI